MKKKNKTQKNNQKDYTKTMSIAWNCQNAVRLARPTNPLFFEGQSVEVSGGVFFLGWAVCRNFWAVFFFRFFFVFFLFFSVFFLEKKTQKQKQNKKTEKKRSPKKKGVTPGPWSPGPPATQPPLTLHWRNLVPVETILCDIQVYASLLLRLVLSICSSLFFPFVFISSCFFHLFLCSSCFFPFVFIFHRCFFWFVSFLFFFLFFYLFWNSSKLELWFS